MNVDKKERAVTRTWRSERHRLKEGGEGGDFKKGSETSENGTREGVRSREGGGGVTRRLKGSNIQS